MRTLAHDHVNTPATAQTAYEEQFGMTPLGQLGAEALRKQLAHIRENIALVSAGDDAEAIHQMRVALRRLRAMASLLGATSAFRRRRVARLRRRLRPLAWRLGAVRDLDIALQRLDDFLCATGEQAQEAGALRKDLQRWREDALKRVRKALRQPATRRLIRHPRRTARRLVARTEDRRRTLVRQVAGGALWSRYEAILRFADVVAGAASPASTEQLHALRIACKQLRYALELFSEEDDARAQSLLATLKEAQDYLGELQDSVFAVGLLKRMRQNHSHDLLLNGFLTAQQARRDELRQGAGQRWERLSGTPFRQELAALIGEM